VKLKNTPDSTCGCGDGAMVGVDGVFVGVDGVFVGVDDDLGGDGALVDVDLGGDGTPIAVNVTVVDVDIDDFGGDGVPVAVDDLGGDVALVGVDKDDLGGDGTSIAVDDTVVDVDNDDFVGGCNVNFGNFNCKGVILEPELVVVVVVVVVGVGVVVGIETIPCLSWYSLPIPFSTNFTFERITEFLSHKIRKRSVGIFFPAFIACCDS